MNALVVDDSKTVRLLMRRILGDLGFRVVEASDGLEALAALQSHPETDICLVDWNMPNMDGYSFLKAVRARHEYAELKVMMVTSESGPEQMVKALGAGADEFLMKPFTADAVNEKLEILGMRT
jgi:two-component system chemotaxis response regulator CheY